MPRLDVSTRGRVVILRQKGYSVSQIRARLLEENTPVSLVAIYKSLKKFKRTGSITDCKRKPSSPKLLNAEHLRFIDDALAEDDELTARRLKHLLEEKWPELSVSIPMLNVYASMISGGFASTQSTVSWFALPTNKSDWHDVRKGSRRKTTLRTFFGVTSVPSSSITMDGCVSER